MLRPSQYLRLHCLEVALGDGVPEGRSASTSSIGDYCMLPSLTRMFLDPYVSEMERARGEEFWSLRGQLAGFRGLPVRE